MKQILFIMAVFSLCSANAQTAQHPDYSKVSGSFYYAKMISGVKNQINVNYALYPAPFYKTANLNLNTAHPLAMKAFVVSNATKAIVLKWTPASDSYNYDTQFDLSALPAGKYHVDVFVEGTKAYTIPFEKHS